MLKAVEFIQALTPYRAGDIAGVDEAEAEKLIEQGIAKPVEKNVEREQHDKSLDKAPVDRMMKKAPEKKEEQ